MPGSAPKRLPVNYIAWPRRKTKINKKRLTVRKLLLRLPCVCLWFAPKELVLQKLIDFCYIHTTKSKHKEPKIGLSIKNKSGKRRLSRGGGLTSKTPSDPCVCRLRKIRKNFNFPKFIFECSKIIFLKITYKLHSSWYHPVTFSLLNDAKTFVQCR